jgi:hypothetical protein
MPRSGKGTHHRYACVCMGVGAMRCTACLATIVQWFQEEKSMGKRRVFSIGAVQVIPHSSIMTHGALLGTTGQPGPSHYLLSRDDHADGRPEPGGADADADGE